MISFTKNDGEIVPATILNLYPHYVFDLTNDDSSGNIKLYLCSKSFSIRKNKLTKSILCLFERRHLLPMQKILRSNINISILQKLIENKILHEKYNLLRFVRLDNLDCDFVDVISNTKGRGFAGTIKRYNFKQGPKTHGSKSHRRPGSIGAGTTPGRVLKNKRMAGHLGNNKVTIKNIQILSRMKYTLIVKGPIPGAAGNDVLVVIKC